VPSAPAHVSAQRSGLRRRHPFINISIAACTRVRVEKGHATCSHLQLVVVQLGVAVGDAHKQPREAGEPAHVTTPSGRSISRHRDRPCRVSLPSTRSSYTTHSVGGSLFELPTLVQLAVTGTAVSSVRSLLRLGAEQAAQACSACLLSRCIQLTCEMACWDEAHGGARGCCSVPPCNQRSLFNPLAETNDNFSSNSETGGFVVSDCFVFWSLSQKREKKNMDKINRSVFQVIADSNFDYFYR